MTRSGSPPRQGVTLLCLIGVCLSAFLVLPASGHAAEATAVFVPGSQSFGSTIIGQRSGQQSFGLRDEGPEPIHVSGIAIGGSDAGDFTIEGDACVGATLSGGESCFVYVSFAPTRGGLRQATLEASHDGEGSPSTAALSGTGLRQELTVSPSPLVFPATTKNMSSETSLTVSNQGDVGVTIFGTNIEGPGSGAFGTGGSNCSGTLAVGSSCMIEVRFSPQSEGEGRALLRINAEGPGGGPTVELSGLGVAPQLRFEPESFDFGLTQTNEGGERTRMVLRNVGPAPTQVGIETSGGSGAFSIGESDCYGTTLAPQGTCSVQVDFRPDETGPYVGTLRADASGMSFGAELSGTGGKAILSASPDPLDLGSTAVGSRGEPETVTIENSGDLSGGFFIAIVSGGDSSSFQLVEEDCTGVPISPGGKCHAVVRFQPTAAGLRKATLSFFGDGEGGQQIPLLGTGVEPARLTAGPTAHAFGIQAVGTAGPTQLFTFTNEGAVAIGVSGASLGGEDRDQFRISRDDCSETSIAPGASCQVGVRFAPDEAGTQSATLRIAGDGGVTSAALSGSGQDASGAAAGAGRAKVSLKRAGGPLRIGGLGLGVGTFSCSSTQSCRVFAEATIVPPRSRSFGLRPSRLTVPAGGDAPLRIYLSRADREAATGGRLRVRWEWRSGASRGLGYTEVALAA